MVAASPASPRPAFRACRQEASDLPRFQRPKNYRRTSSFRHRRLDVINLSPLSAFLGKWGLKPEDESAVIDAVVETVQKSFERLKKSGFNTPNSDKGSFGVEVRNSRDHADEFGTNPLVLRVVIGGTIKEFGVETIGLSQCIDPGNFSSDDSAVVLLDLLSEPHPSPDSIRSLRVAEAGDQGSKAVKVFDAANRETKIAVLGRVIGLITIHEIGHFLGCFHCNNLNDVGCVMDAGGDLPNSVGVGPDGVLDLAEDPEPSISVDNYAPELFPSTLTQSVEAMFVYSLSTGTRSEVERIAELETAKLRVLLASKQLQPTAFADPAGSWINTDWKSPDQEAGFDPADWRSVLTGLPKNWNVKPTSRWEEILETLNGQNKPVMHAEADLERLRRRWEELNASLIKEKTTIE
ncbi:MAG: hypothetical protein QM775_29055 [Pirellulales bacterium]